MRIITKVEEISSLSLRHRSAGESVGLVPTMGALHAGHRSLVERARKENDVVVVSVFVNPTQFNDSTDLATYPRTTEQDAAMLEECGVDYAFMPEVEEMYPTPDVRQFHLGTVMEVMEGAMRPGHFNGVCQVVSKLFDFVKPTRAYFGEKDFQQIAVIRAMVKHLGMKLDIVQCPCVREDDGLAKSSRNVRLTPEARKAAPAIYDTLLRSREFAKNHSVQQTHDWVVSTINAWPEMEVEYFTLCNGDTLDEIGTWDEAQHIVGCITVWCGDVREIDNITYRTPLDNA